MGILPYKVLCNAALCVFHVFLLKVALSKVLDPDIEMNGKIGADELYSAVLIRKPIEVTPSWYLGLNGLNKLNT